MLTGGVLDLVAFKMLFSYMFNKKSRSRLA
jgi:hypothetical protein